jgi:uncharacterized membrane protein
MTEMPANDNLEVRLEDLWRDPRNWRWNLIYACKDDPRTIVRNRWLFGWTWNFAHPRVFRTMAFVILVVVGPALAVAALALPGLAVLVVAIVSVVFVLRMAHRIASRE